VKHVFVETNFFIDVLRPFPKREAEWLLTRHGVDVTLHVPWCSITEAKRTLKRIILEDLGFADGAGRLHRRLQEQQRDDRRAVQDFIKAARELRREALYDFVLRIDGLAARLSVIAPSPAVVERTMAIFPVKSLPPFDEMVLGAVLTHAGELHAGGAKDLFFCDLNTKDFEPGGENDLANAYAGVALQYLDSFNVP
jgi:hypothetical protein